MSHKKLKNRIITPGNSGRAQPGPPRSQELQLTEAQVIDLADAECPKCGGKTFQTCLVFKKLPAVHPGNVMSQNKLVPISTYYCVGCKAEFGTEGVKGCFE